MMLTTSKAAVRMEMTEKTLRSSLRNRRKVAASRPGVSGGGGGGQVWGRSKGERYTRGK